MDILNDITVICFSPTHTSRTIAEAVAAGMNGTPGGTAVHAGASQQIRTVDLTLDRSDSPITVGAGETVVLGAPVYAGRVAPEAVRRLRRIQVAAGASVPAVVTVTYGNRDYEDALVELYDLAISLGLSPFAAGAFIGEHSYSTPEMPVAEGRPDTLDLADARIFGGECARKLDSPGAFAPFHIKGNRPYKEPSRPASDTSHKASGASTDGGPAKTAPAVPSVPMTADGCPLCGECVAVCPTGAVSIDLNARKVLTDPALCIRCCACVLLRLRQSLSRRTAHLHHSIHRLPPRALLRPPGPRDISVTVSSAAGVFCNHSLISRLAM